MHRVAITGIGAVSPNGIGRECFWAATRAGISGVRRITRFDPSGFVVQVAGEVPDEFDETRYVEREGPSPRLARRAAGGGQRGRGPGGCRPRRRLHDAR